jgi:hypothetical protein
MHGTETVLRSASLDELETANEVRDLANLQIERLNGAVALSQGAKPLRFGGVIEIAHDGKLHRTMFAEMGAFELRDKMRAFGVAIGPDGNSPLSKHDARLSANASFGSAWEFSGISPSNHIRL